MRIRFTTNKFKSIEVATNILGGEVIQEYTPAGFVYPVAEIEIQCDFLGVCSAHPETAIYMLPYEHGRKRAVFSAYKPFPEVCIIKDEGQAINDFIEGIRGQHWLKPAFAMGIEPTPKEADQNDAYYRVWTDVRPFDHDALHKSWLSPEDEEYLTR